MVRFSRLSLAFALAALFTGSACERPARRSSRSAAATSSLLGTAAQFAVLGATAVTNVGPTVVSPDLGVWPGTSITGGALVLGSIHTADDVAKQAQSDVGLAYVSLAAQTCNTDLTGTDLGGLTLTAGVYCFSSSAQLTGELILDGQGDANATFVFQIGSTLTTASGATVLLINGATPCSVHWQVGSSATIGTSTSFVGNIFALASVTLTTSAVLQGRALAQTGAVTMDSNTITATQCDVLDGGAGDGGGNSGDGGMGETGATGEGGCCGNEVRCSGACIDLQTDASHCGTCDNACASGQCCMEGVCK